MRANGFSLIECALALLLLSGGLLSVAVTARSSNRLAAQARLALGAAQLAQARIARLEAAPCAAAGGLAAAGLFTERWTVLPAPALRTVSVVVAAPWRGRSIVWRFDTVLLCPAELP